MFKWLRNKKTHDITPHHPMIGKVYKLDNDNPFKEYFVRVIDVKKNDKGVEWVRFSMIFKNGTCYARDCSEKMDIFIKIYKECEV